jgi:Ca2+-binding EF-hand superfamily protein
MKIVLKYLPDETVGHLKDIFTHLDTGHTGYITAADLKNALSDLGYDTAAEEIRRIIKEVDYLSQGRINYTQFLSATLNFKDQITDNVVAETF